MRQARNGTAQDRKGEVERNLSDIMLALYEIAQRRQRFHKAESDYFDINAGYRVLLSHSLPSHRTTTL